MRETERNRRGSEIGRTEREKDKETDREREGGMTNNEKDRGRGSVINKISLEISSLLSAN